MKLYHKLLILGIVGILAFTWIFPPFFRCFFVKLDPNFQEIATNVFVENSFSMKKRISLLKNINLAQKRIYDFWGNQAGKASIIYCESSETYQKITKTNKGAGFSVGTPLGSWIILNQDGMNVDVIAHEMCHDELMTKIG